MNVKASPRPYLWYGTFVLAADVVGVWFLQHRIVQLTHRSIFLALPLAFCLLHLLTIAFFALAMIYLKARREAFEARAKQLEPQLQQYFAEHAYGSDQLSVLRPILKTDAVIVEHFLKETLLAVKGDARERLAQLSATLGFLHKWKREATHATKKTRRSAVTALGLLPLSFSREPLQKALKDREPEIRVLASRALLHSGDRQDVEAIFTFALDQGLRVRACLTEDLRQYAVQLSETAAPKIFAASNARRISNLLEILGAWRRTIRLAGWQRLLRTVKGANRAALIRLFPYITTAEEAESELIEALKDPSSEIKNAAAGVAAHWNLESAIPILTSMLADSRIENALIAAQALTRFGADGERILEAAVLTNERRVSGAALEALENFNTGRLVGTGL
jgi:HEAT repeat protein